MAIGVFEEAYQRVLRHAAQLREAVEEMRAKYEAGTLELIDAIGSIDALPDRGKMVIAWAGKHGWQNLIKEFEGGIKFQAYPLQNGMKDAEVIAIMGQSDVTGMKWMPYNDGNPAWNAQETLAAQAENKAAKEVSYETYTELRKQRLRAYRGGFRYPPTEANGWETWEIRELDADHLASLGY